MRRISSLACLLCAFSLTVGISTAAGGAQSDAATREIRATGAWQTGSGGSVTAQQWDLEGLSYQDGSIRGRVGVADSPLLTAGNLEGQVMGHFVSGTISDDEGNVIVDFDGKVTGSGMKGRYRDRTGEEGEWTWRGRLPR